VYVAQRARGIGVGGALLRRLVEESERQGIWTLQAGIFPENTASIALHEKAGLSRGGDPGAAGLDERPLARCRPYGAAKCSGWIAPHGSKNGRYSPPVGHMQ